MDFLGAHASNAENVRLLRDSNRKPRGAAVVRMSCEEAAVGVISALNGVPVKGQHGGSVVQIRPWRPEFRADRISDENVANSFAWTSRQKPLSSTQQVVDASPSSSYPDAKELLSQMMIQHQNSFTRKTLPPSTITPETFNTDSEEERFATLFIFHLPPTVNEVFLTQLFSRFGGEIESVQIMPNKGYGFISYYRTADAIAAMDRLNGVSLDGLSKPIRIELKY
jgi:RNA recognition motif-containing protein